MSKLSPMDARGEDVLKLQLDNKSLKHCWMLTDGYEVTIAKQTNGEPAKEMVTLSPREMKKLIEWYIKPQETRRRRGDEVSIL